MHPVIIIGVFLFLILAFVLARWAPNPSVARARMEHPGAEVPRLRPAQLRSLAVDLLHAMGFADVESRFGDERRLMALRKDPFRDIRYVVFLEPEPPGDAVEQTTVLELEEAVKSEGAQTGLLITPFAIDRSGLGDFAVPLTLIDGPRLRALVAEFLPARVAELDRYRGFRGDTATTTTPARSPGAGMGSMLTPDTPR